jgi:hypothetical protein
VGAAVVEAAAVVGAAATGAGNDLSLKTKTAGEGARISIARGREAQLARSIASQLWWRGRDYLVRSPELRQKNLILLIVARIPVACARDVPVRAR